MSARAREGALRTLDRATRALEGGGGDDDDGRDGDASARAVRERRGLEDAIASASGKGGSGRTAVGAIDALAAAAAAAAGRDGDVDGRRTIEALVRASDGGFFVEWFGTFVKVLGVGVRGESDGRGAAFEAACEALTETLARAGAVVEVPGVRRDAAQAISHAWQGVLRAMREGSVAGFELARACARAHPSALRPHAKTLEDACAARACASTGTEARESAIACLASMSRIQGDAASWSEHARRLMYEAHAALNDALDGAEDGEFRRQLDAALAPTNEAAPKRLGDEKRIAAIAATDRAISMMNCLEEMFRASFPEAVPMPCAAAVTLASRALACDGTPFSSVPGLAPVPVSIELIIALPHVHLAALGMLDALLQNARILALPYGGRVARALEHTLRTSAPTSTDGARDGDGSVHLARVRARVHDVVATASYALGGAYASGELATAVGSFIIQDAKPRTRTKRSAASEEGKTSKKRKKGGAWGNATAEGLDDLTTVAILDDVDGPSAGAAVLEEMKLQTSALRALAAMCTSGGAMLPPGVRTKVDHVIALAAEQSCATSTSDIDDVSADRRDAAYDALLASVLAPRPFRSPNLPLAIALFSKGSLDPQTSIKCMQASLALNALMHPSAPPLASRAIAPPIERGENNFASAPQWGALNATRDFDDAARYDSTGALRASVGDYYKTASDLAPAPDLSPYEPARADSVEAPRDEPMDTDGAATIDAGDDAPEASRPSSEPAPSAPGFAAAPSSGFAAAAAAASSFVEPKSGPPSDFISFSTQSPAFQKRSTKDDMWDTNPVPVGLGVGASKIAPPELSDDSDGELPEIRTGDDDDDDDDDDDEGDDDDDDEGDDDEGEEVVDDDDDNE